MEIVDDEKVCYCSNYSLKNCGVEVLVTQAIIDKHSVHLILLIRTTCILFKLISWGIAVEVSSKINLLLIEQFIRFSGFVFGKYDLFNAN